MSTQDTLPPSLAPLSPFDAVARALDMASLLAGAVARDDTDKANTYSARLRAHLVRYIYPAEQAQGVPADADLARVAYQGYDSYWTENCLGDETEAWAASAKAVLTHCAAAPQAAPAPSDDTAALRRDLAKAHDSASGFIDEIKMLKQEVRELKAFRAMVNRHSPEFPADADGPRDVWFWQGDHMDHLETMVHTLPVVIRAEQLRELLSKAAPAPQALTDADKLDANRWRETLMRVGATSWFNGGHMFMVNIQAPTNVMQGSVAQHFTAAIDAARAASAGGE